MLFAVCEIISEIDPSLFRQKAAAELKKMRTELSFDHTLLRLVEEDGSLVGETHL